MNLSMRKTVNKSKTFYFERESLVKVLYFIVTKSFIVIKDSADN